MKDTLTNIALVFAEKIHKDQYRNDRITPYFEHIKRVVSITQKIITENRNLFKEEFDPAYDEAGAIAAVHDSLEDTPTTLDDLRNIGMPPRVIKGVLLLTKFPNIEYLDYILNIKRSSIHDLAKFVKLADLTHNLSDLKRGSLRDKYLMAKWILEEDEKIRLAKWLNENK